MEYTKMQACGNDYSYINCFKEYVRDPSKLAVTLADRNVGIGSDGLILIEPSRRADALMRMFNRSGARGKMFGNGVICVVKYIYENQIIPAHRRRALIDTDVGLREATFEVADGSVTRVTVDMGSAVSKGRGVATNKATGELINYEKVDIGSAHAVVFLDKDKDLPLEQAADAVENSGIFPGGIATETVKVISPHEINMLAWETGDGETPACATGAAASVVAGKAKEVLSLPVLVHLKGGDLTIDIDEVTGHCYITGFAETIMTGEIDI